jgi:dTMP kinase
MARGRDTRWPGALRSPRFRALYVALILSSFGDWLGFLATTALAVTLVDSVQAQSFSVAGVLAFRLLPAVLFGPIAGAFADRFDRRRTMVLSDVLRFVLFASIPAVAVGADEHIGLVWLFVASFLVEALSLFWIPAKEASVPNLLPRRDLESANQLSLVATYGTAPLSAGVFAVMGLIATAVDTEAAYLALYVNAATFLFAAWQVSRIDLAPEGGVAPELAPGDVPLSLMASFREGLRFMRTSVLVRGLLVGMLGTLAAAGAVIALGRLFAESVLRGGDAAFGLLFGAVFVGIASGVALGPKLLGDLSRRRAFGISIVFAGLALVLLALVPNLAVAALAVLLVGFFAGIAYVVGLTLLGGEVDDEVRGRTFALVASLMRIDLLATLAVAPAISGAIGFRAVHLPWGGALEINGISVVLLSGGLLTVVVGIASFRQMDDRRGVPLRTDLAGLFRRTTPARRFPGLFIAFEGGEGAGKSSQLEALATELRAAGHEVVCTREPGATQAGTQIRRLLLDPTSDVSPRAEALLYAADRAQHVDEVIVPALVRGAVVLTDRFVDSSLAYQGAGRALQGREVARLSEFATQGVRPDLVLLLDIDPRIGLLRARRVGEPDRIEAESLAFHVAVREQFLELASGGGDRYAVVSAELAPEQVAAAVRARVLPLLPAARLVATA